MPDFHVHMHVSVFDFGGNCKKNHFERFDVLSLTCYSEFSVAGLTVCGRKDNTLKLYCDELFNL